MSQKIRILITGFSSFPGAPYNPTESLVPRLLRLRRPALADTELAGHIFRVSYSAVDRELPALLARHMPHALLMFGLAQRTPYVRIESRARNIVTGLWPDADHTRIDTTRIVPAGETSRQFGSHTALLLRAAQSSRVWAKTSRDAGRYLCNYLCWKAIEAADQQTGPRLAAFVHVPLASRDAVEHHPPSIRRHVRFQELVDAGEAMLITLAKLARQHAIASRQLAPNFKNVSGFS